MNGFGRKLQEMVYVPEDMLGGWEKTNKALVSFGLCVAIFESQITVARDGVGESLG